MLTSLLLSVALASSPPKILMAHYMPWFESTEVSGKWGWHWTMGKVDPDEVDDEDPTPQIASHYHPLIGPYDSGDPALVECHVLLMKLSGFGGVMVDWYGTADLFDYAANDRRTQLVADAAAKAGLQFAVVYEDATVNELIKAQKIKKEDAVIEGVKLMKHLDEGWFAKPNYLKLNGKPVFLVFGPQYYQSADWTEMFKGLQHPPAFFTLHHQKDPAIGAYDWPLPKGGLDGITAERKGFYDRARGWSAFIPVAYPRFHDYYQEAGVGDSYGEVDDLKGQLYTTTLNEALDSSAPIVQVATWNDWGEGTQIEPSIEDGYKFLQLTQKACREHKLPIGKWTAGDLLLPVRLYELRKKYDTDKDVQARLDKLAARLYTGDTSGVGKILSEIEHLK